MRNACVSESMTKSVLLRWAPSLNDRCKLTGQCKDVKSGCATSVGHYHSHILSFKKNSRATVPALSNKHPVPKLKLNY